MTVVAPPAPGFAEVRTGPAGGSVWVGRIPGAAPRRASAVYLPPGYGRGRRRYPVLFLLHGLPGSPSSLYDSLRIARVADRLIERRELPRLVIVMPAATGAEWAGPAETGFVDGVVPWTAAHLATARGAGERALAGICAGGFGALDIGLRHPGLFGTLESLGGYFAPVFHDGPFARASRAALAAHDPTLLVRRDPAVRFYLSTGGSHGAVRRAWTLAFARELAHLRLRHELWLLPRRERGRFWRATLPSALEYAGAGFRSPV